MEGREVICDYSKFDFSQFFASIVETLNCMFLWNLEVGIYKRKQESKKTRKMERKQELDQESDQEKKKIFPFFLLAFLVERVFSFFFFLFSWTLSWSNSYFLDFLFSFINSHPRTAHFQVIKDRSVLTDKEKELTSKYKDGGEQMPYPTHWGGYRVVPRYYTTLNGIYIVPDRWWYCKL